MISYWQTSLRSGEQIYVEIEKKNKQIEIDSEIVIEFECVILGRKHASTGW